MGLERIKQWLRRTVGAVEAEAGGEEPVAVPPTGANSGATDDAERETSTDAQVEGAAGEPRPGGT
jgi:hypothetical protein